jgi:hypothetical protein
MLNRVGLNSSPWRTSLGHYNYHRSFIKDFAKISGPFYEITGKAKFQWKEPQQQALDALFAILHLD